MLARRFSSLFLKNLALLLVIACWSSFLVILGASAEVQKLYGKNIEPYSEARRKAGILAGQKFRKERARSLFGYSNGMLAQEIQQQLNPDANALELTLAIEDWLAVYPKIPSGSQRFLATHAVSLADRIEQRMSPGGKKLRYSSFGIQQREPVSLVEKTKLLELANKMKFEVSTAAKNNHWIPGQYIGNQFTQAPTQADLNFKKTLTETEQLIIACKARAEVKTEKLFPKPPVLSWWPSYIASITNPDGSLQEEGGAKQRDDITLIKFAPNDSDRLAYLLNALSKLYLLLPDTSKEAFAGPVLGCTKELQYSNLQSETDDLFWNVFNSINPTWLEHNEIEFQLHQNTSYYFQKEQAKAIRIFQKIMELEDMFDGGLPHDPHLRILVGDLYDQMGMYKDSRKQYEIAKEINERLVGSGIIEAHEYMNREYRIRMGILKEIQIKSKPKSVLYPTCD